MGTACSNWEHTIQTCLNSLKVKKVFGKKISSLTDLIRAPEVGPERWNKAILAILTQYL